MGVKIVRIQRRKIRAMRMAIQANTRISISMSIRRRMTRQRVKRQNLPVIMIRVRRTRLRNIRRRLTIK